MSIKNLWPEGFQEDNKISAKDLFESQAKLLPKLTNDMIYAELAEVGKVEALNAGLFDEFVFRFDLRGKFIERYSFAVLKFAHDITLYPVTFVLDEGLGEELGIPSNSAGRFVVAVESPEDLELFAERVLRSKRIGDVIGAMLRLSK